MGTLGLVFAFIVILAILGAWYWALAKDKNDHRSLKNQRRIYHRPEKTPLP
jgi:hypothetical protein